MTAVINVRDELGEAPISRFHWIFGLLVTVIMLFDGYDLFNAAYVIPLVRATWQPSPTMIGVMLSSGIVGLTLGSVLQGFLADRFGRRKIMLLALWVLTACNVLLAFTVDSPLSFTICRLILGTALGMITPLVMTYINELTPRKSANTYTILVFMIGFSIGGILAGVIGIVLGQSYGWQWIYVVGALCLVVSIVAQFWFPESIQFLALRNDWVQVQKLLARLRPERAEAYKNAQSFVLSQDEKQGKKRASVLTLLSPMYRRRTIISWSAGFLSLFCIHGLTGWLPTLVIQKGQTISSGFAFGSLIMVTSLFGSIACGWFADRVNSRVISMVVAYLAAAVSMVCLGMYIGKSNVVIFVAAAGFFVFGAQAVLNNFQAMSYHTEIRGTGVGVAVALNRVGGILGPFLIGLLRSINPDPKYTFLGLAGALVLAAICISFGRRNMEWSQTSLPASLENSLQQ